MNLRSGCLRLAIGLASLWFVFWTCAYVLQPPGSLKPEPAFAARVIAPGVLLPCLVAIIGLGAWVWIGFRSAERRYR